MGIQQLSSSKGSLYHVPYQNLTIDPTFNVRDDYGDIDELARSLAEVGQKMPCKVRLSDDSQSLVVVDSHRRLRAIPIANEKYGASIEVVACINEEKGTNEENRILDLFTLNSGKPLTLLEQAKAVKRLLDYNWKPTDIAKKIGKPSTFISSLLAINGSSHELRDAVQKGIVSATAAIKLAARPVSEQKHILTAFNTIENGKKAKLKVKDVETKTKGMPNSVSTSKLKKLISAVDEKAKAKDESRNWADVKYGLQLACGIKELK